MSTKLSKYCEGIMEAAWLATVIVVPVFFNVYSSRIFEPDKITLLRSLALVILAAWLIKILEGGRIIGNQSEPVGSRVKRALKVPLILPIIALAVVYLLATIFSVTPRVSLWGSYQRLQGTYTTLSYIVIFSALVVNLRSRGQIKRLISVVILASLPVSLYGVLQKYRIDPIPWGGNVSSRIAANMGNSIFVAAYLIMVFPLTVMRIVEAFEALLTERGSLGPNIARATCYVFIATLQVIAIYFSGSRGPWLGWGASLIIIWLGLSLIWRKRWLTTAGVTMSLIAAVFLVTLNIPQGPLVELQTVPGFKRLGQLLDVESPTGKVRTLIWGGASELVRPHAPLDYPDGSSDKLNFIRPLIGYGPESMYVAFNPFYPPELAQVEKRNASPDRSHNETWDSLVITGVIGLFMYLSLFGSIIYYGLKWLGLINGFRKRNLFLALILFGGVVSSILFILWRGWGLFGVALPFGVILGAIIYLLVISMFGDYESPQGRINKLRAYLLVGLLAAIVSHFVEINFGIAIAVTRTYFWVYTALLLLIGYLYPLVAGFERVSQNGRDSVLVLDEISSDRSFSQHYPDISENELKNKSNDMGINPKKDRTSSKKKKRRVSKYKTKSNILISSKWLNEAVIAGFIIAILLSTLAYNMISNAQGAKSTSEILWNSIARLRDSTLENTYGVLVLLLVSWLTAAVIMTSETVIYLEERTEQFAQNWMKVFGTILLISSSLAVIFWVWHASGMADLARSTVNTLDGILRQVQNSEGILTKYYIYLLLLVFGLALFVPENWPERSARRKGFSFIGALATFVVAFVVANITNIRVIQADIAFKTAESFTRSNTWPVAISIYNHAIDLAPNEDYYYLFLSRAYLEYAKTLSDPSQREQLIREAAEDLDSAQGINPLNTDHTANLARLYSLWAAFSSNPQQREEHAHTSSDYFSHAVILSPNNARIWDEWALHFLSVQNHPEDAYPLLQNSLELDPSYDWTYGLLGDYYIQKFENSSESTSEESSHALNQALENYQKAIELSQSTPNLLKSNYFVSIGGIYSRLGQLDETIISYEQALKLAPQRVDGWQILEMLSRLYAQRGDLDTAQHYLQMTIERAPDDQKARLEVFLSRITNQP
ncbi:hypothetical protein ACFLV7_02695 [Chloroflexota bacterium]